MSKELRTMTHGTEKPLSYLLRYEAAFAHLVEHEVKLLELGIAKGASLLMWRDYFTKGTIIGLDQNTIEIDDPTGRIHQYHGAQEDTELLSRIVQEQAPNGFDIIIDDCSHIGELTRISFWYLFEYLKPGGIYVIEDWGTGYWSGHVCYPDGRRYRPRKKVTSGLGSGSTLRSLLLWLNGTSLVKHMVPLRKLFQGILARYQFIRRFPSHDYGMIGFVKELIDECGMYDLTHPEWGNPPQRPERFSMMQVFPGQVMITKRC
jgi:hypothetical protein